MCSLTHHAQPLHAWYWQVMPLDGEVCLQAAQHAMVALQYALQECGQHGPFCIEVAGLSHFREQVRHPLSKAPSQLVL